MIAQVAFRLVFGMALTWCLAPRSEITSGYFRIQMLITLALSVLAGLVFASDQNSELVTSLSARMLVALAGVMAAVAYVDSILWTLERRTGGTRGLWLMLGLATIAVWGSSSAHGAAGSLAGIQNLVSEYASGWLMGGILSTMLLGHWYLTATGMKLAPLIQLNRWTGVAVATRAGLALAALFSLGLEELSSTDRVWLILRWAGLLGPLVLAILVVRILRYRNTQSATGVLYASTILIFMGETAALLLDRSKDFGYWL